MDEYLYFLTRKSDTSCYDIAYKYQFDYIAGGSLMSVMAFEDKESDEGLEFTLWEPPHLMEYPGDDSDLYAAHLEIAYACQRLGLPLPKTTIMVEPRHLDISKQSDEKRLVKAINEMKPYAVYFQPTPSNPNGKFSRDLRLLGKS